MGISIYQMKGAKRTLVTPYELIKAKRDGQELAAKDVQAFIEGFTRGQISDYQAAALCMAVFFRGLSPPELAAWTQAMIDSGDVLDLSGVPGRKVDKHSTGGVGDKVSLCLAPLAAACGVPVPMISGRGLGHTGGTLDKMESIPGYRVDLSVDELGRVLREVGVCLTGQTQRLVPADKKLYALRDVTATVESLPLIASSIMSKKLAEGIDGLVLDVKVGSGAFMKTLEQARALARTMVSLGVQMGRRVVALLTDMEQPLGRAVGNALEVKEAVKMLQGDAPPDFTEVTLALTAEMLVLGGQAKDTAAARRRLEEAITSGRGLEKFLAMVAAQGGDTRAVEDLSLLPGARHVEDIPSPLSGHVAAIDTEALGLAAVALGAGREKLDSVIDPAVGFVLHKKVGEPVQAGEPLLQVHFNDFTHLEGVKARLLGAYRIAQAPTPPRPLVHERIEG